MTASTTASWSTRTTPQREATPPSGTVVAGTGKAGTGLNQLSDPQGITLDAKGDLFVADNGNNRVEEFAYNSSTGTYASSATDVAGTGVFGRRTTSSNSRPQWR